MAWVLKFNASTSYLTIPPYTLEANDSVKVKFIHRAASGDRFIFSGYVAGHAGRWQYEVYQNQTYVRLGVNAMPAGNRVNLVDGQEYTAELRKTGTFYEVFLDDVMIWSATTSFTPLPMDAIGASAGGLYVSNMKLEWLITNTRNYSASSSSTGAGAVILNDIGIDDLDAQGVGFAADGSAWENLGGGFQAVWGDKLSVTTIYTDKSGMDILIIGELFDSVELYNTIELSSTLSAPIWTDKP